MYHSTGWSGRYIVNKKINNPLKTSGKFMRTIMFLTVGMHTKGFTSTGSASTIMSYTLYKENEEIT